MLFEEAEKAMKTAHCQAVISPEVGALVAGYGAHDVSVMKYDELMMHGVCFDDGSRRALLLSFDLIGLARELVLELRERCAEALHIAPQDVLLSCTHTHGGPHTRVSNSAAHTYDHEAARIVVENTVAAVRALREEDFHEGDLYSYTAHAPVNMNRRYTGPDNVCRMLFDNRELEPLADGVVDDEVGILFQLDKERIPCEVVVNFAAHPLASHTPGASGHAITSDYPGLLRHYLEESLHAPATFVSGAAGDQFPVDSEIGFHALEKIAGSIARETVRGLVNARCNPARFRMEDTRIRTAIKRFPATVRKDAPRLKAEYRGLEQYELELQLLSIGDVCFVGVPGELLAEPGLEIKWHSPFRHTWICYNSTDYVSYIGHANMLVAGGYEASMQQFAPDTGLKLVRAAVEAMNELKQQA